MKQDPPMVLDLSDVEVKRRLMQKVGSLTGLYEVLLRPRRRTRSLDANSYYWASCVTPWTEWLRENYGDNSISKEQAHDALKRAVMGTKELTSKATGEIIEIVPNSRDLDTKEFSDYIEDCAAFLATFANIVVIPSELFYGEDDPFRKKK